jgi:heat shock protein HtpX
MSKRILLFLATNLAIVVMLSLLLSLLGVGRYVGADGRIDFAALATFCFVWGMGGAFLSLQLSRWTAKRAVGARLIDGRSGVDELDWLHATVGRLASQAQLPMPEVAVYDSPEVNAFATGPSRKRSLVAVSTGLLRGMKRDEIEGVLGHELAHVANGDMVTMTLLQGVINAFVMFFARIVAFMVRQAVPERVAHLAGFATVIVLEIGLGILGSLITAWFSRQREFRADAGGALLAGRGNMSAALHRLLATKHAVDTSQAALASFKIAGSPSWLALFMTHPPLEARIAALDSQR